MRQYVWTGPHRSSSTSAAEIATGRSFGRLVVVALGSFCFILGSFTVQSWGQTLLGQSFKFDAGVVALNFGRTDIDLPWERTDRVDELKAAVAR